jgi:hypothetical protein
MSSIRKSPARIERTPAGDTTLRISHLEILRSGAPEMEAMETFRCRRCGDVIGVYEPLVVCTEWRARLTSRAAEPDMKAAGRTHYHRACYATKAGGG